MFVCSVVHALNLPIVKPGGGKTSMHKHTRLNADHFRVRAMPNPLFSSDARVAGSKPTPNNRIRPSAVLTVLKVGHLALRARRCPNSHPAYFYFADFRGFQARVPGG